MSAALAVLNRRSRLWRTDLVFVLALAALLVLGLVMVKSASYGFALVDGGEDSEPNYFVNRQAVFAIVGGMVAWLISRVPYRIWARYALPILGLSVLVLIGVLLSGQEHQSTLRWLFRGSLQPAEFAKIGLMIYIAAWLGNRGDQLRSTGWGLLAFALLLGGVCALILLQPNFSTMIILAVTAIVMFFAAGASMKQMVILLTVGVAASYVLVQVASYRSERLDLFLEGPFSDPTGEGMQLVQVLVALSRGGWFGVGLGHSQQKFTVYAPHTDGIFAIIAEELGLMGCLILILLYGVWTWRGLRIAYYARDAYGRILAVGLTTWVVLQASVHIGVMTASIPFTGTVLPFVSYGGSSLSSMLVGAGLILSISRDESSPEEGQTQ